MSGLISLQQNVAIATHSSGISAMRASRLSVLVVMLAYKSFLLLYIGPPAVA
eukprot:CAMPEP_0182589598 /NCGR_PEP_ID=MMETSP1324-20130603/69909_1 /TAXON_ID=236786 /ORGANISM="Florenciella sp., Strain RCC1587" /LENGTH=51 /DNA_ID=CAMNT_0024806747 /DNA_START=185 /DNA_END=340 /DNA_ORIENTATION=-